MASDPDPYRTLGLPRDATLDEVRRAYRRLAKANHPDAAGEAALPRFLAIQAAYDTIAGPDARRRPGAARPTGPRRPWDPERDRTDATYRAYGGRARRARPTGTSGAGRGGSAERPSAGPSADRPPGTSRPPRPERPPNKATLGSTSYDGADAEPFEPDWRGASWYGTTSGTYWTLNPKEYADPRKHGPEYQARARRELDGRGEADGPDAAAPPRSEAPSAAHATSASGETSPPGATDTASEPSPTDRAEEPAVPRTPPPPTHTTASWWEATAGDPPRTEASGTAGTRPGERRSYAAPPGNNLAGPGAAPTGATAGMSADTLLEAVRTWLDDTHPGTVGRIARALLGWAPIALGIGWAGGEMSGCGRFAAGCDDTVATSAWVVQIAALLVLIVVGRLARITSVATLATLVAAIPAALLLSATGGPDDLAAGRIALSGLLVIAWVVGLVFGIVREVRGVASQTGAGGAGPPGDPDRTGPVS
jgi:curved DNA-binding protein CbpA